MGQKEAVHIRGESWEAERRSLMESQFLMGVLMGLVVRELWQLIATKRRDHRNAERRFPKP